MGDYSASPARRAAAYWFIDGLQEIVSGAAMALCGGMGLALWSAGLSPLFGFLGLLLLWKDRGVVEFLKTRLTYPRTGYVRPPEDAEDDPPQTIVTLMSVPAAAVDKNVTHFRYRTVTPLVMGALYTGLTDRAWIWPVAVCIAVAALYVLNRKLERPYRWWELLPLAAAGAALMRLNMSRDLRPFPALVLAGAWLLVLGGGKLARYLRLHPRPGRAGAHA
jgi:hypothetical protein